MSLLVFAAMAAASAPRVDHTDDIAVVAHFLANVRSGTADGAGIEVVNYEKPSIANFEAFAAYANACQIAEVSAIASATRHLPISVKWDCGRFVVLDGKPVWEERHAGFWVKTGRVVKLAFGAIPTIAIPAI